MNDSDVAGYRDPEHEVERLHGGWNCLELWAAGDTIRYKVNGNLVNEGSGSSLRKGKILFQSEGAELWFRKIEMTPLAPTVPAVAPSSSTALAPVAVEAAAGASPSRASTGATPMRRARESLPGMRPMPDAVAV